MINIKKIILYLYNTYSQFLCNCFLRSIVVSIFVGYLMLNTSLEKDSSGATHKKIHTSPKGISPKVNVIAQLEFELAYSNVTIQHISHYAMVTSHYQFLKNSPI